MKGFFALRKQNLRSVVPSLLSTAPAEAAKQPVAGGLDLPHTQQVQIAGGVPISLELAGSVARSRKIEAIRKAVACGSYEVSSSDVADKVMDYMRGR